MIEDVDLPATILRPNYFMQNDASLRDALLGQGVYPQPIGSKGISMIDARDIAEAAALFLLEREHAAESLPREMVELVGPDAFTGEAVAGVWSEVLGRQIHSGGDDLAAFEKRLGSFAPHGMARDMRLMMSRVQQQGMAAKPEAVARLTDLLGRAPRSYRDFAAETAKRWQNAKR